MLAGKIGRRSLLDERVRARVPLRQRLFGQGLGQAACDFGDPGRIGPDDIGQRLLGEIDVADEPHDTVHQQVLKIAIEFKLHRARHCAVERIDRGVEIAQAEGIPRRRIGGSDRRRIGARLVDETRHHGGASPVDDRVGKLRGDDLAAQAVVGDRIREAFTHRGREISLQLLAEIGIVRHRAVEQFIVERQLRVGEEHRQFRSRQGFATPGAFRQGRVVGQIFDGAVESPLRFQHMHQASGKSEIADTTTLRQGERQRLKEVIAQHEFRHVVRHLDQERVAILLGQAAIAFRHREADLDVDLDVGGVHAGRIVDGVGIEPDPRARCLDAAPLGHAEIGAFADHLRADLAARDADRIVGAVADLLVALRGGAHIGADAAEPQQTQPVP